MICKKCNKEYDSSMDFIEEIELLEAMDYFVDIESICPDCIYKLRDKFEEIVEENKW